MKLLSDQVNVFLFVKKNQMVFLKKKRKKIFPEKEKTVFCIEKTERKEAIRKRVQ